MQLLYQAHSGLRYLVLLIGIAAIVTLLLSLGKERPLGASRGLSAAFTGLLHLQLLLGLGLVLGGLFYGAVTGHLTMMILAVIAAQGSSIAAKRASDPRKATTMRLGGIVAALLLIVFGITAIGRSPFGRAPATVVGATAPAAP